MALLVGVMSELRPFQPCVGDILGRLHVATPGIREGQASTTFTGLRWVIDCPGKRQGMLKQGKRFFEVIFAHEQVAHGTARHGFKLFVPQTMSQVQRLLPVSDALALPAQAYCQQSGQLHQYVYAFWAGMILQPRERCFQGRLGRGVCLEPAPGAPKPMRGSQAQEQGSPLTLFCGEEFEGDAIVLQGIFRCRGLPCLLSSAAGVVRSA